MARLIALLLILVGAPAFAQAVPCVGPTQGNCVPVIIAQSSAGTAGYPAGATPVAAVFAGADTTTQAASIAAVAGKFSYACGFSISGLGSTAGGTVVATLAALATLSYSYVFTASVATPNAPVSFSFNPCLPGSAVNTAVTLTVPGSAGNTATQINLWGYQL
jgi:hypothetical protein